MIFKAKAVDNVFESANKVAAEISSVEDVEVLSDKDKLNDLVLVLKAQEDTKALKKTKSLVLSASMTRLETKRQELFDSLASDDSYKSLMTEIDNLSSEIESLNEEMNSLNNLEKKYSSVSKLLSGSDDMLQLVSNENVVGLDSDQQGWNKRVLNVKEISTSYEVVGDLFEFITAHPELRDFIYFNIPEDMEIDSNIGMILDSLVASGELRKNIVKTVSVSSKKSDVNNLNWLGVEE